MFSNKIMSLLNQFIPVGLAMKGLEKVDPRMKSFIGSAVGFGYGANEIIDYLRSKSHTAAQKANRQDLEQRVAQGTARPDEAANLERLKQSEVPGDVLQGAATGAAGLLGGMGAAGLLKGAAQGASPALQSQASRVGSVASQPIAQQSAPNTIAPASLTPQPSPLASQASRMGGVASRPIAQQGASNVIPPASLKGRMAGGRAQPVQATPQVPSDIFLKKHPELGMFLEKKINEGIAPAEAAKRARGVTKFKSKISSLEDHLGQPFEDIVSQVFGMPEAASQSQGNTAQDIAQLQALMQQWMAMRGGRGG
jgi:hypothetical protein